MLLPARRQILGRDLRIQILALVRAWETDCRIRRKREFRRNRVFSIFFLPSLLLSPPPGPPIAFRAVSDHKSNSRFIRRTDWSTCLRVAQRKSFYGISLGKRVVYDEKEKKNAHRWWLNSHPRCTLPRGNIHRKKMCALEEWELLTMRIIRCLFLRIVERAHWSSIKGRVV